MKSDNFTLNKPSKALLGYLGAGFLCKAIGILTTPIFTRLLSESDYGSLAFFLSLSGILLGILSPLVSGSQIYGILTRSGERAENVFLSGLFPIFSVTLLISAALFSASLFFGLDLIFSGLLSLQILSDSVLFLYLTVKRYEYRGATVAVITVAESILSPILSIGLIRLSGGGYLWRIAGLILPPLFISAFLILREIWRGAVATASLSGKILKECAPLVPSSFLGAIGGYKDRLLTAFLLGGAAVAKYSVAHSLGAGLLFATSAVSSAYVPWMIRRLEKDEGERVFPVTGKVISVLCCLSALVIGLAPEAMQILAPPSYSEALPAVMPVCLSVVFSFVYSSATAALVHKKQRRAIFVCRLFSLFGGLVSGLIFIPALGYFGAGFGVFSGELFGAAASVFALRKKTDLAPMIPHGSLIVGLFIFLISAALPLLYTRTFVRICLLFIPSGVLAALIFRSGKLIADRG